MSNKHAKTTFHIVLWLIISISILYLPIEMLKLHHRILHLCFGTLLIYISIETPMKLKSETMQVFSYKIGNIKKKSLYDDYKQDTEEWMDRVFHRDMRSIIFFIMILFVVTCSFFTFILFNIENFTEIAPFFSEINATADSFTLVIFYGVFASYFTLLFFFVRIAIVCFGVSNIMHHFSFWTYEENMDVKKDPSAGLILLNFIIFLTATSCLAPVFIGIAFCGMIFIISPINPDNNYQDSIQFNRLNGNESQAHRRFQILFTCLWVVFPFVRLIFTFNLSITFLALTFFEIIMVYLYSLIIYRFFQGKNGSEEDYSFKSPNICQRKPKKANRIKKTLLCIISALPVISISIDLIVYYVDNSVLLQEHMTLVVCCILYSITFILLFSGIKYIKNKTKAIAEIYFPYTRIDKQTEMKYHFWETFRSPQKWIFSLPYGFIFILWNEDLYTQISLYRSFLGLTLQSRIILDICFLMLGLTFGNLIWTFYHAPHFSWHSMELVEINIEDLQENPELFDKKPLNRQFSAIIIISICSLLTFGFGYYIFAQFGILTYLSVYSIIAIFFIIMTVGYRLIVTRSLQEKKKLFT